MALVLPPPIGMFPFATTTPTAPPGVPDIARLRLLLLAARNPADIIPGTPGFLASQHPGLGRGVEPVNASGGWDPQNPHPFAGTAPAPPTGGAPGEAAPAPSLARLAARGRLSRIPAA